MPRPRDTGPLYRFHGRHAPEQGTRTPLLAAPTGVRGATVDEAGVAELRLYDPIDSWGGDWGVSAKEFVDTLDQVRDATQINLRINSPGGDVFEALAIINSIRAHPANVTAIVDGLAASAASLIGCACDELVMMPNSQLMVHDAWGVCIGPAADMRQMGDLLDRQSNNSAAVYAAKAGGTVEEWRAVQEAETWYTDQEAVDAGLADRVDNGAAPEPAARQAFDLTAFKHAGRQEAPAPPVLPAARAQKRDEAAAAARARRLQESRDRTRAIVAALDPDQSMLSQALGWFTAIDNIVDEAQETIAAHLGVPNPDSDDGDDPATGEPPAA